MGQLPRAGTEARASRSSPTGLGPEGYTVPGAELGSLIRRPPAHTPTRAGSFARGAWPSLPLVSSSVVMALLTLGPVLGFSIFSKCPLGRKEPLPPIPPTTPEVRPGGHGHCPPAPRPQWPPGHAQAPAGGGRHRPFSKDCSVFLGRDPVSSGLQCRQIGGQFDTSPRGHLDHSVQQTQRAAAGPGIAVPSFLP